MIILPENYTQIYPCINRSGSTAEIFANEYYTKAYKIYRNRFKYNKEKFDAFLKFHNENCFLPKEIVSIENKPNLYVGYEMDYDNGIALRQIIDESLSKLIESSLELITTLEEISSHHFIISDPNPDNITFSNNYKFVDTYSFLLSKKHIDEAIFKRNLIKVNISVLSGLLGFSYQENVINYLRTINSKYLDYYINLKKTNINFIYDILSIIQESTKEDSLRNAKKKILLPYNKL